ncbi:hypothetical protein N7527_007880 [Penicillium freii]|uniref:Uncharacterized protein n=1 Tax=Penicillium freii TaxID=48697 RepID=A0A117NK39_PENFR|nr:hypothetical protein N7527_007880 [Penicillium freii]KUM55508.1 hypothetical protein ACN42_g11758 [Penicillium freii]
MLPSNPSSRRTTYKAFRPVTPLEQASHVWELGNVPIAPGFYEADQDEELAGRILPQIQLTSSGFNTSNLGTPFPPAVAQLRRRLNLSSLKRPPELLPAFSSKRQRLQSQLACSSALDATSEEGIPWDICELLWNMRTALLKYHHRKIENGSSGYSCLAKKAIFKELARRERDGGH